MTDVSAQPAFALQPDELPAGLGAGPQIDTAVVRDLAQILKETDLTTIEVEHHGLRIRVAREVMVQAAPLATPAMTPAAAAAQPAEVAAPPPAAAEAPPPAQGEQVASPMVGTVYLQAQPGTPPFVKVGDTVAEGQTLVLVEAMKTMNPIPAPRAGVVMQLLVGDGQPVEYGEPLVVLG